MAEDVMTKQQAASYLHISVATLEHWTRAGLLLTGACMATPQSAWLRPIATLAWTRPTRPACRRRHSLRPACGRWRRCSMRTFCRRAEAMLCPRRGGGSMRGMVSV
jgi:hypothetical protein